MFHDFTLELPSFPKLPKSQGVQNNKQKGQGLLVIIVQEEKN